MEQIQFWQLLLVLLSISAALLAPTVWFYKHNTGKLEDNNKLIISKLEHSNTQSFSNIRDDLKDFRNHFDNRISEVYIAVDAKNREMKQFVSSELEFVRNHITSIEDKLDVTRERSHAIEKDLLMLQAAIGKDYITKDDLQHFIDRERASGR